MHWQPIETAPPGGRMLVCGGEWTSDLASDPTDKGPWLVRREAPDYYVVTGTCYYSAWVINPTLWMPSPALPEDVKP